MNCAVTNPLLKSTKYQIFGKSTTGLQACYVTYSLNNIVYLVFSLTTYQKNQGMLLHHDAL